jgi:phage tail-like protein
VHSGAISVSKDFAEARPHRNSNFLVDLGYGDPSASSAGFCEVIFPDFHIDFTVDASSHDVDAVASNEIKPRRLVLRRGVTGSLDLYAWWDKARKGKAPKQRTVKVSLLADDHVSVVLTWHFRRARPVSLSYSPLNALHEAVLIETIELEFETMEMR